jgi:hypothetical protein
VGLGQLGDPEIRGVQAIGLGITQAFQQLGDIVIVRPGGAIATMAIKIQHDSVHIDPLMTRRGEQRRKRRTQWRQLRLNRLANIITGSRFSHSANGRYRLNRRSLRDRRAAYQKAHKKHAAYDE